MTRSAPVPLTLTEPAPPVHVLHPGDVACGGRGERFETLLGSCVAIVLTDPRRTVGAMCHIVHARPPAGDATPSAAYADHALDALFGLLRRRGINPSLCEAYVYGGGNMFPGLFGGSHVGDANHRWAMDALAHHRIRVLASEVGGRSYRRVGWTVGPEAPHVVAVPV